MPIEIKMPALSPTMTEGTVALWLKKEGDKINSGDIIVEVQTDKAIMEVDCPFKGILGKILIEPNVVVKVGETIALILKNDEDMSVLNNYIIENNNKQRATINHNDNDLKNNKIHTINTKEINVKEVNNNIIDSEKSRIFISPLAKKIATIENINIDLIQNGSGPNGRIIKSDIENFINSKIINNQNKCKNNENINRNKSEYKEIAISGMRKVIASRLLESKITIPHFYISIDINMSELLKFKDTINSGALKFEKESTEFYKISINDLIIKATALSMRKYPNINSSWQNDKILEYSNIDISVAVSIEEGLITPIIKNADQKNLIFISNEVKSLIKKAKNNTLMPNEYQGGGITISNLGMFDIKNFIPIINPPQSSILAIGSTKKQPIFNEKNNQIEIKDICSVTIAADHRVVDGVVVANFINEIKLILENPVLMIMENIY